MHTPAGAQPDLLNLWRDELPCSNRSVVKNFIGSTVELNDSPHVSVQSIRAFLESLLSLVRPMLKSTSLLCCCFSNSSYLESWTILVAPRDSENRSHGIWDMRRRCRHLRLCCLLSSRHHPNSCCYPTPHLTSVARPYGSPWSYSNTGTAPLPGQSLQCQHDVLISSSVGLEQETRDGQNYTSFLKISME
jgi:hypothetical protein